MTIKTLDFNVFSACTFSTPSSIAPLDEEVRISAYKRGFFHTMSKHHHWFPQLNLFTTSTGGFDASVFCRKFVDYDDQIDAFNEMLAIIPIMKNIDRAEFAYQSVVRLGNELMVDCLNLIGIEYGEYSFTVVCPFSLDDQDHPYFIKTRSSEMLKSRTDITQVAEMLFGAKYMDLPDHIADMDKKEFYDYITLTKKHHLLVTRRIELDALQEHDNNYE